MKIVRIIGGGFGLLLAGGEYRRLLKMVEAYVTGETAPGYAGEEFPEYQGMKYSTPRDVEDWKLHAELATHAGSEPPVTPPDGK